ncbi:response regulator transcription factor [Marinobacterium lutimaris]|uniref:Two component transcriptional regulator, LuxR family n=1 Tax=Marinobacterium lutimaris TaxID=568106 RepID=A0A1H5V6H2_9GAMM|nr:response regulator transcription factor [Marinobacterium lutimaris]SEF82804.1 two component transcriptional regulator, LuxR family [Marinobacterium lutimaris]
MKNVLLLEDYVEWSVLIEHAIKLAFGPVQIHLATSIKGAASLLDRHRFDLAILDLNLPDGCGIETLNRITREQPSTHCVVATVADDDESLFNSLRAGASGYLLKSEPPQMLAEHLKGMLSGQPPLSPAMASRIIAHFSEPPRPNGALNELLTVREREVLKLIARGASRKQIARELDISTYTANDHVKSIYKKLNIRSRVEATRIALDSGLAS